MSTSHEKATYDICLIAEGTYPFVSGGVSSVIAQMINGMPNLRFAIFYIGSTPDLAVKAVYPVPEHVGLIEKVFLFGGLSDRQKLHRTKKSKSKIALYQTLSDFLLCEDDADRDDRFTALIDAFINCGDQVTFADYCNDTESWNILVAACQQHYPEISFIDIFYTSRFIALPVWILLSSLHRMPKAKVYHSLCTGYAGLAGAISARRAGGKSIITEHGIYVKERISEISLATWIHEAQSTYVAVASDLGDLKRLWIAKFKYMAEYAYRQADCLTTLYNGNRVLQEEFGAPIGKCQIIPNGIDMQAFETTYEQRQIRLKNCSPRIIGFVGRIVRIKDVKTLLRAMAIINQQMPEARLKLFGPTNEDPDYYNECLEMSCHLGLKDVVDFAGKQNLRDALADIDIMVLTSISEGQPLVVLEGFAAGIPCVSTDVGSCRALIFGDSDKDKSLGSAGVLTKVASPRQTANALLRLLRAPETIKSYGETGRKRVETYYQQIEILKTYQDIYSELMGNKSTYTTSIKKGK